MAKNVKRLYTTFRPEHYAVETALSEDKQKFIGTTTITGKKVGRPSKRITLHQKNLKIISITLVQIETSSKRRDVQLQRFVSHRTFDELRIHASELLYAGTYEITLEYEGLITKNMDGIYPCFFKDEGEDKQLIATQFESHHAREVFPCIDEPEAKATFDVTLVHATDEIALSNTPVLTSVLDGKRTRTTFSTTPVMSTYLVAFVVGELKYLEKKSKNGVLIRTYAVPEQIEHAKFALEVAVNAMDFYEEYYDIRFPLPKCDFVALPDFASGAMENWGLITFREQTLLVDPHTSLSMKQYVAIVVAHELTHQWFGNLVTMRWWTDLWLNEGFASWMEYLAVDHLYPEWDLWTQFAVDEQQTALRADSLEHTHPIEVPVHHPDEIRTIFDSISYQKGASVIHMLYNYLGAVGFRDGLRHYLKTYSYSNTDTVDLWRSLEEVTKKPVMKFMQRWTKQAGYPLLQVAKEKSTIVLSQHRFVTNPNSVVRNDEHIWDIPLLCENTDIEVVSKRHARIALKDSDLPVLINKGMHGFYRIDYDHGLQESLLKCIDKGTLSEVERMGLLSDGLETTKAGYQSVDEFLLLLEHFENEDSLPVWEIIASALGSIRQTLAISDEDTDLREIMKPFIRRLVAKQQEYLGWEKRHGEKHLETLLRPLIISLASQADDTQTVDTLLNLYRQRMDHNEHVDPDLRSIMYTTAVRQGGKKEFEELTTLYKNSTSSDEKLSITSALTSFDSTDLHEKVLSFMRTDAVRMQDLGYWIAYSFMNRHARKITWQWMKTNWHWLKQNLGTDLSFYRMPVYVARNFATEEFKKEYVDFFTNRMEPVLRRSYDQGLEMIETNVAWRNRDAAKVIEWFKSRQS